MHHAHDSRIQLREFVEYLRCRITAAVIDDNDLEIRREQSGGLHRPYNEAGDGAAIVVGRKKHTEPGRTRLTRFARRGHVVRGNRHLETRIVLRPTRPRANARRHGVISDSISTDDESLDAPWRRSTNTIGTSAIVTPALAA